MSTHYIEEAERLCDLVTIMSHGKAVAVGVPRELIAEHAGHRGDRGLRPAEATSEVENIARKRGWSTRRTGTSVSVLRTTATALDGVWRVTNSRTYSCS